MCLNPHGAENESSSSHSALILAGSFDGRVAVFKNDFSRPNDFRIMSTFQASGRTTVGKLMTWRDTNRHVSPPSPVIGDVEHERVAPVIRKSDGRNNNDSGGSQPWVGPSTIDAAWNAVDESPPYSDVLKQHGKGLVLAFNPESAHLAAGGLDEEIVRIWNLECERCVWEGPSVQLSLIHI